MKISNKFFFGALIAASIALVGCNQDAAGDADMIKVSGANASIEEYNASEDGIENKRGFKTIKGTKWKQGIYKITFENPEDSGDSVMGLIFDEYEKDDLYNFYCLGLKVNPAKNGLACYLSYFPNVKSENLSSDSGTFYGSDVSEEVEIIKGVKTSNSSGAYLDLGTVEKNENGAMSVYVSVTQPEKNAETNSYYILTVGKNFDTETNTVTELFALTEENGTTTLAEHSKAEDTNKYLENYMGFYANVKTGKNLIGSWTEMWHARSAAVVEE